MATPKSSKVKTRARRTTYVVWLTGGGIPVPMPMFGPPSLTSEDAQARLDKAMTSGKYSHGEVREVR